MRQQRCGLQEVAILAIAGPRIESASAETYQRVFTDAGSLREIWGVICGAMICTGPNGEPKKRAIEVAPTGTVSLGARMTPGVVASTSPSGRTGRCKYQRNAGSVGKSVQTIVP